MSIPYHDNLSWTVYKSKTNWAEDVVASAPATLEGSENQTRRAANELFIQTFKQTGVRGVQFIRDTLRLVLKVPIRAVKSPFILSKNWKQYERAKINAKLTGYSFVQLIFVPAKFLVALAALATSAISAKKAQWLLDNMDSCTAYLDGRASQLEALKEEGATNALNRDEFKGYKEWLYSIEPKLCRKTT